MQPERAEIVPEVCGQWKKGCSGKYLIYAGLLHVRKVIMQFSFSWAPMEAVWISGKWKELLFMVSFEWLM